jgi:hypothetical protein
LSATRAKPKGIDITNIAVLATILQRRSVMSEPASDRGQACGTVASWLHRWCTVIARAIGDRWQVFLGAKR